MISTSIININKYKFYYFLQNKNYNKLELLKLKLKMSTLLNIKEDKENEEYRIEKDTIGYIKVPNNKYWGAQTQRSLENFKIGNQKMPMELIYAMATLKKASALTNIELTDFSKEKANAIILTCDEIINHKHDTEFPLVIWQTGSGTQTNMNVNEVIANRATEILGGDFRINKLISANDDVNKSQSSNDTFPTAMHIAIYCKIVEYTLPAINELYESIYNKALLYKDIIKIGRTHLMDATPLTLGQEFSGYATQLKKGIESINDSLKRLREIALGGTAVGTGLNCPNGYAELVANKIALLTGHPFITADNKFTSLSSHDSIVEISSSLKRIAVSLIHIANNIRLLGSGPRCGIGELNLPVNEPGSSIMPGKVNPTQCESLSMICCQVIGNDTAVTIGGTHGHFQLNVFTPMMASNVLHSATLLADGCKSFNEKCILGIEPNLIKIKMHLNQSLMLVTALNPKIGYYKSAEIAQLAHKENITLKEACLKLGHLNEKEFDEAINPIDMVGNTDIKK